MRSLTRGRDQVWQRLFALVLMFASGEVLADEVRFVLVNGTRYSIRELALSPHDLATWGPNVLRPPVIKPGEQRQVTFPAYVVDCNVDLKVVFQDEDSQPIWQYLNLCNLKKVRLNYDRMSGITTASYDE